MDARLSSRAVTVEDLFYGVVVPVALVAVVYGLCWWHDTRGRR